MPSFSLRKLRSRSTSRTRAKRLHDNEAASSSRNNGIGVAGSNNSRSNSLTTNKSAKTKSVTPPSKSKQQHSSTTTTTTTTTGHAVNISPDGLKFLGSTQRPSSSNNNHTAAATMYSMADTSIQPPSKRIGRQLSTGSDTSSLAYSSAASETSDGEFITAFDRMPPTFSGDVLDREDLFPSPSAEVVGGSYSYSRTWETDHELSVLEDMSNEWTMFSDPSFENRNPMNVTKNMGALQRDHYYTTSSHDEEKEERVENSHHVKSARLISPDSSPNKSWDDENTFPQAAAASSSTAVTAAAAVVDTSNDDLSAWGLASPAASTTVTTKPVDNNGESVTTNNSFGSNFFNNSNFDDDDGDDFFGQSNSWAAMASSTPKPLSNESSKSPTIDAGDVDDDVERSSNDPWGRTGGGANPFTDEKKDEDSGSVIFTNMSLPDPITPTTEPIHPLKQQQQRSHDKAKNEVVVSFEDYGNELRQSPSNSSFSSRPLTLERNVSYERGNRPPVTAKSHRRINSNGSQSQGSRRRSGRSGGSVGSNSSAVDQILEQYRQKRLAKQNNGRPVSATSSVASSSQPSTSNHHSLPSMDSLSSVPSSTVAAGVGAISNSVQPSLLRPTSSNQQQPSPPPLIINRGSKEGVVDWPDDDGAFNATTPAPSTRNNRNIEKPTTAQLAVDDVGDQFLMANIEATIGPRGCAPDMESLRSSPPRRRNRQASDARSVDSRTSRNSRYSFRTYESNRSALKSSMNTMSPESKSVANDLFRLEAQLAEVARQQELQGDEVVTSPREVIYVNDNATLDKNNSSNSEMSNSNGYIGAEPVPRTNPITVVAPPGKLGILLSNNKPGGGVSTPTYVSAVRSESVLAGKVQVGDLFMKIDGEDVSQLTSKRIMAIMAHKIDLERILEFRCLQSSYDPQEWI